MSQTPRLAAILAADVAGYSRLMGADEEGTLERLNRTLTDLSIKPLKRLGIDLVWRSCNARNLS